jgi:hypothetical protein
VQATITHASQHHLSAAGAPFTSIKIMSTMRALKKAMSRTAVPIQAPLTETSSHHESKVARVRTIQVRKKRSLMVNSSQQVEKWEKDDPHQVQHVPETARKTDQWFADFTVRRYHMAQVHGCRTKQSHTNEQVK